jgi:hypothetical protein
MALGDLTDIARKIATIVLRFLFEDRTEKARAGVP